MSKQNNGGPAFPFHIPAENYNPAETYFGLSLRDYFAAAYLTGLVAAGGGSNYESEAEEAYKSANAMLKARGMSEEAAGRTQQEVGK